MEKKKERTDIEKKQLTVRLNKIAGQINGIKEMIDTNRYCGDILIQISAVDKALKSLGNMVLKSHVETCVSDKIKKDDTEIIDELMELIKRMS